MSEGDQRDTHGMRIVIAVDTESNETDQVAPIRHSQEDSYEYRDTHGFHCQSGGIESCNQEVAMLPEDREHQNH